MAKRKRELANGAGSAPAVKTRKSAETAETTPSKSKEAATSQEIHHTNGNAEAQDVPPPPNPWTAETTTIQIITGSYERVLHGFTATLPQALITGNDHIPKEKQDDDPQTTFSDTFLFNAHTSAIRCLALSPPPKNINGKLFLATGSTDERINLYAVSLCPPALSTKKSQLPTLHGTPITENCRNKELGTLLHHSSSITALYFPTRAKLLSSAEDSAIAITRTRDWTPLSTIKAPIPKPQGRPSGDTAAPGEVPAGINDFAVHPSMKLMLSVGKGEKCMRLWNLVTGKKAGVLNFGREILSAVGEGRFGTGEGRRVVWGAEGDGFAVAYERGAAIFGIDCKPKGVVMPTPRTKLHQMHYLPASGGENILAVSTEDGRIIFYETSTKPDEAGKLPSCALIAQLGGPAAGMTTRVKDFEIIPIPPSTDSPEPGFLVVAGSSDGSVRLWLLRNAELTQEASRSDSNGEKAESGFTARQVGKVVGTYTTGARITCLKAFVMTGKPDEAEEDAEEERKDVEGSSSDSDSE